MKFRATTNSIRIRVRKSDLALLQVNTSVAEQVHFPGGGQWGFNLMITEKNATVAWEPHTIVVAIPQQQAKAWINSNEVGLEYFLPLESGEQLHLLIEKDFPCKTREEDLSDTFFELEEKEC